ncbi:MAG: MBL fold metallo-hydrolase [Kiritimatiellae bacterium]|nr:MBL fold metallo-hydrolase [Kiritimatiellia bacterium]
MTINRRDFLGAGLAAGASVLSGRCDDLEMRPDFRLVGKKWAGWSKGHFQIHSIYTGVGESLYLIFPDGTSALVDCGDWPAVKRGKLAVPVLPNSDTHAGEWIARYIERVNPIQPEVGYMIVSHFHSDHTGIESWAKPKPPDFPDNGGCARSGFALVAEKVKFRRAIDRGWPDYNQPLVIDKDGAEELAHMKKVYAWLQKRDGLHIERIRLGATDQIVPLHDRKSYPDFEVKNICGNGLVFRTDGTVDDSLYLRYKNTGRKSENAMSMGHIFRYGAFSFFTAGDFSDYLKNDDGTVCAIEDVLSEAVGKVQVAKVNHHGHWSMPKKLVGTLQARVWLVCVWDQLHILSPVAEVLADRDIYSGKRMICPSVFTAERRAEDKGKPWTKDVPKALYEGSHMIFDVPPGGSTYTMSVIPAKDESMTVSAVFGFRS